MTMKIAYLEAGPLLSSMQESYSHMIDGSSTKAELIRLAVAISVRGFIFDTVAPGQRRLACLLNDARHWAREGFRKVIGKR